ncbi:hypothetical protein L1887_55543 [Cichorium endivia]|nr:hypothetical protein L1887_55543 [Cichorium endivia]
MLPRTKSFDEPPIQPTTQPTPPVHQQNRFATNIRHDLPSRIPTKAGTLQQASSEPGTATLPASLTAARQDALGAQEDRVRPHSKPASQPRRRLSRTTNLQPPPTTRTPSLVSGSSLQSFDSPRSHGLRRKPSTISSFSAQRREQGPKVEVEGHVAMDSRGRGDEDSLHDDDAVLAKTAGHGRCFTSPAASPRILNILFQFNYQSQDHRKPSNVGKVLAPSHPSHTAKATDNDEA